MRQSSRSDTELVIAARGDRETAARGDRETAGGAGSNTAFGELFERWFNSSWNVARTIVRSDDLAADVAQDALLTAWRQLDQLDNPDAFGGWLLRITRNRALTRLEREQRSRAIGDDVVSGLRDGGLPDPTGAAQPMAPDSISEVRDRQELVWAAAAALGESEASLLDLHLRHGLSPAEIAEELGVEPNSAHQQLFRLRKRLGDAIGSYLLWRNGRPLCEGLAAAVSGDVAFDRSVSRAVARHQESCDYCSERRAALVDPGKLFAGAPLVLVPTQLKAQAAATLESAGVPIDSAGSTVDGGDTGSGGDTGGAGSSSGDPSGTSGTSGTNILSEDVDTTAGYRGGYQGSPNAAPTSTPAPTSMPNMPGRSGAEGGVKTVATRHNLAVVGAGVASAVVVIVAIFGIRALLADDSEGNNVEAIASEIPPEDTSGGVLAGPTAQASERGDNQDRGSLADRLGPLSDTASGGAGDDGSAADGSDGSPSGGSTPTSASPAESTTSAAPPTTAASTTAPSTTLIQSTTTSLLTTTTRPITTTTRPVTTTTRPATTTTRPATTTTRPVTTTTRPPSTTTEAPGPVTIIRFTSRGASGPLLCSDRTQRPFQAVWATENADSVTLTTPNSTHQGEPTGSHRFCGTTGDSISLLATGPGGQDKATTTL